METRNCILFFLVGRKHGKAIMFAENIDIKPSLSEPEVIDCTKSGSDSEEDMETDQPALKKVKKLSNG